MDYFCKLFTASFQPSRRDKVSERPALLYFPSQPSINLKDFCNGVHTSVPFYVDRDHALLNVVVCSLLCHLMRFERYCSFRIYYARPNLILFCIRHIFRPSGCFLPYFLSIRFGLFFSSGSSRWFKQYRS